MAKIPLEELLPETRRKLKLDSPNIDPKLISLGKILIALQDLTNREAIWALKTALDHIRGYRKKGTRA